LRLNASRNIGLSANVSARALKVAGTSFAVFFQHEGMSPHALFEIHELHNVLPNSVRQNSIWDSNYRPKSGIERVLKVVRDANSKIIS
jgi:hypothetical protein